MAMYIDIPKSNLYIAKFKQYTCCKIQLIESHGDMANVHSDILPPGSPPYGHFACLINQLLICIVLVHSAVGCSHPSGADALTHVKYLVRTLEG